MSEEGIIRSKDLIDVISRIQAMENPINKEEVSTILQALKLKRPRSKDDDLQEVTKKSKRTVFIVIANDVLPEMKEKIKNKEVAVHVINMPLTLISRIQDLQDHLKTVEELQDLREYKVYRGLFEFYYKGELQYYNQNLVENTKEEPYFLYLNETLGKDPEDFSFFEYRRIPREGGGISGSYPVANANFIKFLDSKNNEPLPLEVDGVPLLANIKKQLKNNIFLSKDSILSLLNTILCNLIPNDSKFKLQSQFQVGSQEYGFIANSDTALLIPDEEKCTRALILVSCRNMYESIDSAVFQNLDLLRPYAYNHDYTYYCGIATNGQQWVFTCYKKRDGSKRFLLETKENFLISNIMSLNLGKIACDGLEDDKFETNKLIAILKRIRLLISCGSKIDDELNSVL